MKYLWLSLQSIWPWSTDFEWCSPEGFVDHNICLAYGTSIRQMYTLIMKAVMRKVSYTWVGNIYEVWLQYSFNVTNWIKSFYTNLQGDTYLACSCLTVFLDKVSSGETKVVLHTISQNLSPCVSKTKFKSHLQRTGDSHAYILLIVFLAGNHITISGMALLLNFSCKDYPTCSEVIQYYFLGENIFIHINAKMTRLY